VHYRFHLALLQVLCFLIKMYHKALKPR